MTRYRPLFLLFSALLMGMAGASGQMKQPIFQPDALLIQLSSEHNRMQALKARGDEEGMKQLDKDLHGVFRAIRNDFRDHFTACPVYYFIDTSLAKVKARRLDGVLIDTGGNFLKRNPLAGKKFQLASYGYPKSRVGRTGYLPNDEDSHDFDTRFGKVWVVYDKEMRQVSYSKPRSKLSLQGGPPAQDAYNYTSPKYNIDYRACADRLQKAMLDMGPR